MLAEVIAHYDPKGSCARGHPSTPYAIGKPDGDAIGISTNEKRKVMAKTSINVRPCNIGSAGTAQPTQQGTRLHTSGTLPPQRTMVGNEDYGCAGGHKGKVQAAHRSVHAEEGDTHPEGEWS